MPARWSRHDLSAFEIYDDLSVGDIMTISISTPLGSVQIMAEIEFLNRTLMLRQAHIQSDSGPITVGVPNLRVIADFILERTDCDEARVEGATRTTGANPWRRPRILRFTRRPRP